MNLNYDLHATWNWWTSLRRNGLNKWNSSKSSFVFQIISTVDFVKWNAWLYFIYKCFTCPFLLSFIPSTHFSSPKMKCFIQISHTFLTDVNNKIYPWDSMTIRTQTRIKCNLYCFLMLKAIHCIFHTFEKNLFFQNNCWKSITLCFLGLSCTITTFGRNCDFFYLPFLSRGDPIHIHHQEWPTEQREKSISMFIQTFSLPAEKSCKGENILIT